MKLLYRLFALTVAAVLATGCLEDKGNYDYRDINELIITLSKPSVSIVVGEVAEVESTIKFVNGQGDADRLIYKWDVDGETRPEWNTPNFSWTPDRMYSNCNLKLEILDPVTGITYISEIAFDVKSRFDKDGLQILAEKDGETQFSFIRATETKFIDGMNYITKCDEFRDVYATENEERLPDGAIRVQEHFCDDSNTIGQMLILTRNGAVDANGLEYKKEVDLQTVFENGTYPQDFGYASDAFGMSRVDLVADSRGHVYSRIKHTPKLFHSGEYLDQRLTLDDQELAGCTFVQAPFYQFKACLVYEEPKKRFLLITDTGTIGSGNLAPAHAGIPLRLPEPTTIPEGYVSLNDLSSVNILSIGYLRGTGYNSMGYTLIFERNGKVFCQEFAVEKSWSKCEYAVTAATVNEITGLPGIPSMTYSFPYKSDNGMVLCNVGKELWLYDRNNPKTPATKYGLEFSAPIVAMNGENYCSRWLALALEDGTVMILNAVSMDNPEKKIVFYQSEESYGKVTDVYFKRRGDNEWQVDRS